MTEPNQPSIAAFPSPDGLSRLLLQVAAGDRRAFTATYQEAAPQLFALALRMMKQRDLAEEVLQEVFVSIWVKAGRFDPGKGSALAWMAAILRNRCLDRLRTRRPESSIADEDAAEWTDPAPGPLDRALRSAEGRAIWRCLDRLEPGPRNAILRVYYEGLTHAELADRATIPLGTIKSWIRRGLTRLKSCLDE